MSPEQPSASVILVPGNDEHKEWMVPMAEAACARGLAALAIDLPGYGESGLRGTRLDGRVAVALCARAAVAWLRARGLPRIGTFGVSLGGLVAHLVAALAPVAHARAVAAAIGARAELRLVDGGDHMANPHLRRETAFAMDWLATRLSG